MIGQDNPAACAEAAAVLGAELLQPGAAPRAAAQGIDPGLAQVAEHLLRAGKLKLRLLLAAVQESEIAAVQHGLNLGQSGTGQAKAGQLPDFAQVVRAIERKGCNAARDKMRGQLGQQAAQIIEPVQSGGGDDQVKAAWQRQGLNVTGQKSHCRSKGGGRKAAGKVRHQIIEDQFLHAADPLGQLAGQETSAATDFQHPLLWPAVLLGQQVEQVFRHLLLNQGMTVIAARSPLKPAADKLLVKARLGQVQRTAGCSLLFNYIERGHLTMRTFSSRLTEKGIAFSKIISSSR